MSENEHIVGCSDVVNAIEDILSNFTAVAKFCDCDGDVCSCETIEEFACDLSGENVHADSKHE